MRKRVWTAILLGVCLLTLSEVYAAETEVLIEGQEKTVKLFAPWVDKFQQDNPGIAIRVSERREAEGFADLISGSCDIVISRKGPKDKATAKDEKINKIAVAAEGVTFVVNPQNPVNKLTVSELKDILSGKIINWNEVGGSYGEITIYGPSADSWANDLVKEYILNSAGVEPKTGITYRALNLSSSEEIRQQVAGQLSAMGYYPGTYVPAGLKALSVAKDASAEYIFPAKDKTPDALYPFQRPIFFWTRGSDASVKLFIDRVLTKDYQEMLSAYGAYPVKANDQNN
jgi:phosphate transport system substrate-binding protein